MRACACVRAGERGREGDQGVPGLEGGRLGGRYLVELGGGCCWVCGGARLPAYAFTLACVSESGGAGRGGVRGALRPWVLENHA